MIHFLTFILQVLRISSKDHPTTNLMTTPFEGLPVQKTSVLIFSGVLVEKTSYMTVPLPTSQKQNWLPLYCHLCCLCYICYYNLNGYTFFVNIFNNWVKEHGSINIYTFICTQERSCKSIFCYSTFFIAIYLIHCTRTSHRIDSVKSGFNDKI